MESSNRLKTLGQIWAITIPKGRLPAALDSRQAEQSVRDGAVALSEGNDVQLVAVGAYQRQVCEAVADDLSQKGISCGIVCLLEPGRFRDPRDVVEAEHQSSSHIRGALFPSDIKLRVFVCHMRPETLLGVCRPLDLGRDRTLAFRYTNHGRTLDTAGLLMANGSDPQSVSQAIVSRLGSLVCNTGRSNHE
ncbi:MAG: hypothetical protein V7713_14945 [Marinobacter sp.]|uniref:hypothetical protein n=1 Tax=Marinobacter sp. AC-23 TaxID=1879031 RepID=UPI0008DD24EA|nr:hypothetical protein [Marinobacter sp. AC-23]OHY82881.1 hypothetical protein BCA33_01425 [Marinobacter sp. AC-23]